MKARNLLVFTAIALLFSGCVIWSFYPLYTESDLFENDILKGKWIVSDEENMTWEFSHPVTKTQNNEITNRKSYLLTLKDYDSIKTEYSVHIIKLNGTYFLDFYLEEINSFKKESQKDDDITIWNLHVVPVHTFAKLTVQADTLQINWFDGDWLKKKIEGREIKIRHELNDETLLLTAKTKDLQKLVVKYANSEEAFKDGLSFKLIRDK